MDKMKTTPYFVFVTIIVFALVGLFFCERIGGSTHLSFQIKIMCFLRQTVSKLKESKCLAGWVLVFILLTELSKVGNFLPNLFVRCYIRNCLVSVYFLISLSLVYSSLVFNYRI